jgi:hypothetical protein
MTKPTISTFNTIAPLLIQEYTRYLPTAFDESLSMLQKVNKIIKKLDELGNLSNSIVTQWNTVMDWVMNDGLTDAVNLQLDVWLQDGTVNEIFNSIFNSYKTISIPADVLGMVVNTDIADTLQTALNNGNLDITFPSGEFLLSKMVTLPKGTRLRSKADTTFKRTGTDLMMFLNGTYGKYDYATGQSANGNILIEGGIFDLNSLVNVPALTTDNTSCFNFGLGDNIEMRAFTIKNGQNGHYLQISGCTNVYIHDFKMLNQYSTNTSKTFESIQVESVYTNSGGTPSFPYFYSTGKTVSKNVKVSRGTFSNVIRGLGTHSYALDTDGVTPLQCDTIIFEDLIGDTTLDHAITLYGYKNYEVKNASFTNVGGNMFTLSNSIRGDVHHNTGTSVTGMFATLVNADYNSLKNNRGVDVGLSNTSDYSAYRLENSNHNDIDILLSGTPKYQYPVNMVSGVNNRFSLLEYGLGIGTGIGGDIYANSSDILKQQVYTGGYDTTLFEGSLSTIGQTFDFDYNLATFKQIIVVGNANSGSALMQTFVIPNQQLILSSVASRYRFQTSFTLSDFIEFHFEAYTNSSGKGKHKITIDANQSISVIRGIYGIR